MTENLRDIANANEEEIELTSDPVSVEETIASTITRNTGYSPVSFHIAMTMPSDAPDREWDSAHNQFNALVEFVRTMLSQ